MTGDEEWMPGLNPQLDRWLRLRRIDAPPLGIERPIVLRTSAQIDAELLDRQIAYSMEFLREKGLHAKADELAALRFPTA